MMSAAPFDLFAAGRLGSSVIGPPAPKLPSLHTAPPVTHAAPVLSPPKFAGPLQPPPFPLPPTAGQSDGLARFTSLDEYRQYVIGSLVSQYKDLFGQPFSYVVYPGGICFGATAGSVVNSTAILSGAQAASVSNSNDQVAGVNESDLMQTDGSYLYMLSQGELVVVDLRTADSPAIAGRLKLPEAPSAMYLDGDRVTLISSGYSNGSAYPSGRTTATVIDVSDRTAPKIVQRTVFDGYLLASRAIGDNVYLVFQPADRASELGGPIVVHNDGSPLAPGESPYYGRYQINNPSFGINNSLALAPIAGQPVGGYRYETQQEYIARIATALETSLLPHFTTYDASGNQITSGNVCDPSGIYKPLTDGPGQDFTTVAKIDMKSDKPGPSDSIIVPTGYTVTIYASSTSMYLLGNNETNGSDRTIIDKIDLAAADGKLRFTAQGSVKGYVLDQFSADESDGYLRVATTDGSTAQSYLFELQQSGKSLRVIGSLDNLAPGESIYSVRFQGPAAYVVTFRQVDPLFAIDLSDPTAPKLAGRLDMPGFSNYLQSVGDGFLIGVGRTADGPDSGYYSDPQVSLFNVKDLANPVLADRVTIPADRSGGLGIFSDHHVVEYYADQGILTVSMPAATTDDSYWSYSYTNDLYVFRVDTSSSSPGLKLLGTIAHDDSVLRSVEVGDRLISISQETVAVHSFAQPLVAVTSLTINPPGGDTLPVEPKPIFVPPIVVAPPLMPIIVGTPIASPVITLAPATLPTLAPVPGSTGKISPSSHTFSWSIEPLIGPRMGH
jgi:uncharacterized secreted protein with C-terminal beta-propeller domain